jgi:F0F1-type ATP synthase assembly protein I
VLTRALVNLIVAVACIAAGFGIGWLLDGLAESRPLLTLFGSLVGLVVAIVFMWSRVRRSPQSAGR